MKRGKLIIDSSRNSADLLYLTGFMMPDPFVYFSVDGEVSGIVVPALELARARNEVKEGIKVFERDDIISKDCIEKGLKAVIKGIAEKFSVDVWELPASFPLVYAKYLDSIGVNYHCIEKDFLPGRRSKTSDELKYLFDASKLTEKAMLRAETILRESVIQSDCRLLWQGRGLTSEIIKREINIEAIRGDGVAAGTIVACGKHSSEPHNTGSGVIMAGQPIVVDIFPRMEKSGYWGDMTRTFVKGKAPEVVKRAYTAVKDARDLAKRRIKAGVISSELYSDVLDYLDNQGFKTGKSDVGSYCGFFHGLCHGLGLEIHEEPSVSGTNDSPLCVNDVISVEPGVYYPEWGGVRLEDIVVVKKDGIECLTEYPDCLEID